MPNILVTNDDGIDAPGLRALVGALDGIATVYVVAPDRERSAAAQSLTLVEPVFYRSVAEREWAVEGTPTDAVILALNKLLPERPDLLLSGINNGGNLGENVYYSGTVAAAMEGCINGIPACAISLTGKRKEPDFSGAAKFARALAELALKEPLPKGVMLNANVPTNWNGDVRLTRQSPKITRNVLKEGTDPRGRTFVWLSEQKHIDESEPDTDYAAIFAGSVSLTPLELDRTHPEFLNHLSHWAAHLTV
jgi:5'-nucleotidase